MTKHDRVIKDTPILTSVYLLISALALALIASILLLTSVKNIGHDH
ncbi:hypothetical protein BH23BAC1_BH23BAC1_48650 [soil metagenome]